VFGWFETQDGSLLLLTFGCFFSLGITLWSIRFEDSPRWKVGFACLQFGAAMISLLASGRFYVASQGGAAWQAIEPPILFTFGVAAVVASIHWNEKLWSFGPRMARAARQVGLATYPLYLLHSEIGRAAMLRTTSLPPHLSLFVTAAGMIVLAFLVVKLEQVPRSLLKRAIGLVPGLAPAGQCAPPELP
jgi:peptidoglycan/LPS O-acetylase OafA/YrhL